ncbi:hypothetical protein GBA52_005053 [Prunus armeniaca]|nr:hypothetical protein GBA52_005053 [Prunus armeniaca]
MGGRGTTPNAGMGGRGIVPNVGMDGRGSIPSVQVGGTNRQPSATQPTVFIFASGTPAQSVVISQSPKFKPPAKKAMPWRK